MILVVEDDALIRMVAEMMIQDWGHETLPAGDEAEALAILRSSQRIDAMFTTSISNHRCLVGVISLTKPSHFDRNCGCSTPRAISSPTK